MARSPFDYRGGTLQKRLVAPSGWSPTAEGSAAFILGHDQPGKRWNLAQGDYVEIAQAATWAALLLRFTAKIRPPAADAGVAWELTLRVDGAVFATIPITPGDRTRVRSDVAGLLAGIGGGSHTVALRLTLATLSAPREVELPGVYLDALIQDAPAAALQVINRDPEPLERMAPLTAAAFTLVDTSGAGVALASVVVTVGGALAYTASAFTAAFVGSSVTSVTGGFAFSLVPTTPFASDSDVALRVIASTTGATASTDTTWTFHTSDITPPGIVEAFATSYREVRVTFTEAVVEVDPSSSSDALDPTNYAIELVAGAPAVTPEILSVRASGASTVLLALDRTQTPRASYLLTTGGLTDIAGNPIVGPGNVATFTGYQPPIPEGRRFSLVELFPAINASEDDSGDYHAFLACYQEIANLLLDRIDRFGDILDPDLAPPEWLDLILADLGNPFGDFHLSDQDKVRLIHTLVIIYQGKGTDPGIIDAILFFMGLVVTITTPTRPAFGLGSVQISDPLGTPPFQPADAWQLSASTLREKLTFAVNAPTLTDDQRRIMTRLVRYMKRSATHFSIVEPPPPPTVIDHVSLGFSQLGINWQLHPHS